MEKWHIEIKDKNGNWVAVRPTNGQPYAFENEMMATRMMELCYPQQTKREVRIRKVED